MVLGATRNIASSNLILQRNMPLHPMPLHGSYLQQHWYHFHCISRWLKERETCPLCNSQWEFHKYGPACVIYRRSPSSFL